MELVEIAGHTFDKSLLGDGCIIDVGCRGFVFADYFPDKNVWCIDPDPTVFDNKTRNLNHGYMSVAISDHAGDGQYYENGEGTCLKMPGHFQDHRIKPCKLITMDDLYKITGENVDVLKLDCEGAEYTILGESFKPIPKQITVEFHYHCFPDLHKKNIDSIMERMKKNYRIINLIWEQRHGCGFNYWDILFIKR